MMGTLRAEPARLEALDMRRSAGSGGGLSYDTLRGVAGPALALGGCIAALLVVCVRARGSGGASWDAAGRLAGGRFGPCAEMVLERAGGAGGSVSVNADIPRDATGTGTSYPSFP